MIVLDTCVLIDALTGPRRSALPVRAAIGRGERVVLTSIVLYEWLRGPRIPEELAAQETLFPSRLALPFGDIQARRAALLFRHVKAPRGREIDLAIASCAISWQATLWTLNVKDFRDVPGLTASVPD